MAPTFHAGGVFDEAAERFTIEIKVQTLANRPILLAELTDVIKVARQF